MKVPFFLFAASLAGVLAALGVPGWSDLLLLAGPAALAGLLLLGVAAVRAARSGGEWILIDGSNVMYWKDGTPRIETVREVVGHLAAQGLKAEVVFDANAGHLLFGRYRHDEFLARALGLPKSRVMVVPKGTQADGYLLQAAHDMDGRIVTNDRYRDWAEAYPELCRPGRLVRGGYGSGRLQLDLGTGAADRSARSS